MRPRALLLSSLLAAVAAAGCDACDKPGATTDAGGATDGARDGATAVSGDASSDAQAGPSILAAPGCRLRTPGGSALTGKLEPGTVTVSVANGKALVVNTLFKDPRKLDASDEERPRESAKSERLTLAANGLPDGPFEPIIGPHGADEGTATPLTWAVATSYKNDLTTLSYGTGRSGAAECKGGTLLLEGSGNPVHVLPEKRCRFASALAGAARGELAVALLDGPTALPATTKTWPAIVEAVVYSGAKASTLELEKSSEPGKVARIEAPAAAVGKSIAAVAYRIVTPESRELHVAVLDASGKRIGKTLVLDKGDVGAPTLAFEDDALHVVWAARASDREPYVLRWSKVSEAGAATTAQRLSTGLASAFAPALAIDGGRYLVSWMEGDDKRGAVKVGVSKRGLAAAVALARVVSSEGTNARDPEVGLDKTSMFLVWQELTKDSQGLRAAALECME